MVEQAKQHKKTPKKPITVSLVMKPRKEVGPVGKI